MEELLIIESIIMKPLTVRVIGFELEIVNNSDYSDILNLERTTFYILIFLMESIIM